MPIGPLRRRHWLVVGLLVLATLAVTAQEVTDRPDETDRAGVLTAEEILLKVFDRTGGFRWTSHVNWLGDDVCTYEGVTCYEDQDDLAGHVRKVDLADNHLAGTLPGDIFALPYLESLVLRDNSDLYVNFDTVGDAQHLKDLVISGTNTDSLEGVEAATSLETLHITRLGLTGPIPDAIFQLSNLKGLFANFNSFSGRLSTQIGSFFYLTDLYLYDNNLDGPIPTEIGQLVNLQTLALGDNAWTGQLPSQLDRCTDLRTVSIQRSADNLEGTGLTGSVLTLSGMENINQVDFSNQRLSGNIPQSFLAVAPKNKPIQVDLSGNQITGSIPESLVDKTSLTLLLADNQITALDTSFCAQVPQWMGASVGPIGCDAILCPPGTYNSAGRQTSTANTCQDCPSSTSPYLGTTTCVSAPSSQEFERETLVKLFNQMGGPYWKTSTNWLDPSASVCSWFGISCNNSGQVTAIRLRNNDLTKAPPSDVFRLSQLTVLDLAENTLDFSFDDIGEAVRLQTLDLTQTDLKSLDGVEALQQTQIRKLALGSNILDGALPDILFSLVNLEELDVSHNFFAGNLPDELGNLVNLRTLYVFGNAFNGELPTRLGLLNQLKELKAGENSFSGNLPTELGNLAGLEVLSLHQTTTAGAIGGDLPAFADLQQLTSLQLAGNALQGSLPGNFLQNTLQGSNEVEVLLGGNFLSGEIPSSWAGRFDNLFLDLTDNRISGFGSGICSQTNWMGGSVGQFGCDAILCPRGKFNEFGRQSTTEGICRDCDQANVLGATECGGAPSSPGADEIDILQALYDATHGDSWTRADGWRATSDYCSWFGIDCNAAGSVIKITLAQNGLTGTPPSSVFSLGSLRELDFSHNQISFAFEGIENASSLTKLTVTGTNLNSVDGLENARSLLELEVDDNDIGGTFPSQFLALTNLRRLSANRNNIIGRLPDSISSLKDLTELSLFSNRLTGQLPASVGNLVKLEVFALSQNNFQGTIPPGYGDLESLRVLAIQREGGTDGSDGDIGINQGASEDEGAGLSGPLPAFDRLAKLRRVYLGTNSLEGSIPDNFLGGVDDQNADIVVDLIGNRLTGGIPGSLARFESMVLFVAGNRLTEDIPSGICRQAGWMYGQVGSDGCNVILCPPATYSPAGRKTDSSSCTACPSGEAAPYLGSFGCRTSEEQTASNERSLLEEFYRETNGDGWRKNEFWMDPDVPICSWHGVTCDSSGVGTVQSIELMQNGLTGRVPSSIFQLVNLKELNVAENEADMSFSGIRNAQNLEYLNIDSMSLSSLTGLGQAPNLLQLHAASNDLGPGFPTDIFSLTSVEVLYLSHNNFGENIPLEGNQWANLKSFTCVNCGFEGFLPPVIANWAKLERLDLADNEYNGPFLTDIEELPELQYLDISKQRTSTNIGLSGFLPSFSNRTTKLRQVYLAENDFFGTVPPTFLSVTTSEEVTVDLSRNFLNGTIPESLGRFQNSVFLFADNQFGPVPSSLCALGWNGQPRGDTSCDFVMCQPGTYNGIGRATVTLPCDECVDNALFAGSTGCADVEREVLKDLFLGTEGSQWLHNDGWGSYTDVCEWYGVTCHTDGNRIGTVQKVDLRGNNLAGKLSSRIWELTEMEELDLSDNTLELQSFQGIHEAASLSVLKLSNNIVETLNFIEGATKLKAFHCTSCDIHGNITDAFYSLTGLERLYLNYNHLSGPVNGEPGMRSLVNLVEIYLFSNELSGELPDQFGSRFAEVISIGHNRFSGTVPRRYSQLRRLRVFSAEYEEPESLPTDGDYTFRSWGLDGTLPDFYLAPKLRELYLAGNSLDGTIPSTFLERVDDTSATIHVDISSNFLMGTIPSQLARFDDLRLVASNNLIDEVPPTLCDKSSWMDGLLATGCDALLCTPGTFNEVGRRTASASCETCDYRYGARYFGSTKCGPSEPDKSEFEILEEFFETAGGEVWKDNSGWVSKSVPICNWYGISCTKNADGNDSVSEISLPSNNLVKRVASLVFHLPSLRVLDVSRNAVGMSFHDAGRATSLEELNVSETNIVSVEGLGRARALTKLSMGDISLYGQEIPTEIYRLDGLTHLNLSRNGLMGTLSSQFSALPALVSLELAGNDLAGSIPPSLGSLAKLKMLDLSDNLLYGEIPSSVNNLASLESLNLSSRNRGGVGLSGSLPAFAGLGKIRFLDLGANSLTGTIPDNLLLGVDDPTQEITISLEKNIIHGTLPISLNRFTRLNIDLTDNEIDSIDQGLCEMTLWWGGDVAQHECDAILCPAGHYNDVGRQDSADNRCEECPGEENSPYLGSTRCPSLQKAAAKKVLEDLYDATGGPNWKRRKNWLTHPDICAWDGITCKDGLEVETVNLGSNNLSGRPPKEVFELPGLKNLWLYSNPIDFSFEGIQNAKTLSNLQLDSIGLRSLEGVGEATALTYVDVRFNALEGPLSSEIEKLTNLETLLISDNNLFGPFPVLESNTRLSTLKVDGNGFSGPLPSLSMHPNLRRVDVTGNQFNGEIPDDLLARVDSSKPVLLFLGDNKLSGVLPASLARFDDLTIYVNDNEIIGIDSDLCEKDKWNGGEVERFGCDAIACPPGSYSEVGRASSESGDCMPCNHADFFGHSLCISGSGGIVVSATHVATALVALCTILFYV